MTTSVVQSGALIAQEVRESSAVGAFQLPLKTLCDLLETLAQNPPPTFPMLRTTCALLTSYLDKPAAEITVESVNATRDGFRRYLEGHKYAENSIRTYVNHVSMLLKNARAYGWVSSESIPEEWRDAIALASKMKCVDLAKYLARLRLVPRDVTIADVDAWVQMRVRQGLSSKWASRTKRQLWRVLRKCNCTVQNQIFFLREKRYGVPLEQFPLGLKREVSELLRWKCAEYSLDRPKNGRHRQVTSNRLRQIICSVLGFAINICEESEIPSLSHLLQKRVIGGFVEWSINERKVKGRSLHSSLSLLFAAIHQHPSYESLDFRWFKPLLDGIPLERESELKKRKAEKYLEYKVVESIPAQIRAKRPMAVKKGINHVALLAMQELLMKWLTVLPWRQRNVRECRISGLAPNLFVAKIPPFSDIDKPEWVKEEEQRNPEAQFWQFGFSSNETKTGNEAKALLPRQLIGLLEEYLREFRPHLIRHADPGTLLINHNGTALTSNQLEAAVSTLTLRHGGRRVTPHLFRDIVAFQWLKEHPEDFLTLSKMLWHSNINTTIKTYGGRFNESSGVCAMESWLEEREAKLR